MVSSMVGWVSSVGAVVGAVAGSVSSGSDANSSRLERGVQPPVSRAHFWPSTVSAPNTATLVPLGMVPRGAEVLSGLA